MKTSKKKLLPSGKNEKQKKILLLYLLLMMVSAAVMNVIEEEMNISDENTFFSLISFTFVGLFFTKFCLSLKTLLDKRAPVIRFALGYAVVIYCFGVAMALLNWITGGILL